jgi:hypothetical protein
MESLAYLAMDECQMLTTLNVIDAPVKPIFGPKVVNTYEESFASRHL